MDICNCIAPVVHQVANKSMVCRRCNRWWMPEHGSKPAVTKAEIENAAKRLKALMLPHKL
jgi:hypothetical protein